MFRSDNLTKSYNSCHVLLRLVVGWEPSTPPRGQFFDRPVWPSDQNCSMDPHKQLWSANETFASIWNEKDKLPIHGMSIYCSSAQCYQGWTLTSALKQYLPQGSDNTLVMLSGYNYQQNRSYNHLYKHVNSLCSELLRNCLCLQIQTSIITGNRGHNRLAGVQHALRTDPLFLTHQRKHWSL